MTVVLPCVLGQGSSDDFSFSVCSCSCGTSKQLVQVHIALCIQRIIFAESQPCTSNNSKLVLQRWLSKKERWRGLWVLNRKNAEIQNSSRTIFELEVYSKIENLLYCTSLLVEVCFLVIIYFLISKTSMNLSTSWHSLLYFCSYRLEKPLWLRQAMLPLHILPC